MFVCFLLGTVDGTQSKWSQVDHPVSPPFLGTRGVVTHPTRERLHTPSLRSGRIGEGPSAVNTTSLRGGVASFGIPRLWWDSDVTDGAARGGCREVCSPCSLPVSRRRSKGRLVRPVDRDPLFWTLYTGVSLGRVQSSFRSDDRLSVLSSHPGWYRMEPPPTYPGSTLD